MDSKIYSRLADLLNARTSTGAFSASASGGLGWLSALSSNVPQQRTTPLAEAVRRFATRGAFGAEIPPPPRYTLADALKANKQAHDSLLRVLVNMLTRPGSGFELLHVALDGWDHPEQINWKSTGQGHIPDASAWLGHVKHIFEVETADSIGSDHTRRQCALFAAYAEQNYGKFILFVPSGEELRARRQLASWGLRGEVW